MLRGLGLGLTALGVAAAMRAPAAATIVPALVVGAAAVGTFTTRERVALRLLEIALFAAAAALIVGATDRMASETNATTVWRDAALVSAVVAFAYGALVPNTLPRAALGVVLLAATPLALLALWSERDPPLVRAITAGGVAGTVGLLAIAAVVAVAAHALMATFLALTVRTRSADMYQLLDKIGSGGMGEIWRARHRRLSRTAAIKLIRPDKLQDPAAARRAICRFEIEAKSTAQLRSPNTIEVYDFGTTQNGTFYYVMEYLEGLDLAQLVERAGPLPADRLLFLLDQVCRSLSDAHKQGLVHRDIKPANIFVSRHEAAHDHVKVLDFGLVRPVERGTADGASAPSQVVGTPAFMAPEMIEGDDRVDNRTDIYAIGCVAYFALTGELVFDAATPMAAAVAHATATPEPPSKRTAHRVPADLERVVLRCLHKAPDDRFADCQDLRAALAECEDFGRWDPEQARTWWQHHARA